MKRAIVQCFLGTLTLILYLRKHGRVPSIIEMYRVSYMEETS